ncbi:hypothetical protein NUH88_08905 [Nisaea acidiphila]|uniref:Tail assembly chaperone n=1 Tax=Nisaea acidiphila TaxID=1862145 RepID=A0A9J7AXL1_9PROT|nr:hypothetical protein [Nisaea acidiphila]UUX51806.1 hypothetical protein NUH88_08905 [Nisaea acidiphila]
MDLSRFKSDREAEDDGVWVALDGSENASVKLARIGNRRYRDAMQRRMKPFRRALRAGTLEEATAERITAEVLAETVLLDWRDLTLDGRALTYSPERALSLLLDPALRDFRDLIVEMASDIELYRQQDQEAAEKNLPPSSAGTSPGAKNRIS